jgi:hypothetical protein
MLWGILKGNEIMTSSKKYYAEEALYLLEKRQLLVQSEGSTLSLQQLFFLLEIDTELYQVYCHLRQRGYHVFRSVLDDSYFTHRRVQFQASKVIPHFNVYNINQNFRETKKGTPDFQVVVLTSNDNLDFSTISNNQIPLKICINNCGNIQFLSVSNVCE